jgi:hypothetical protein
VTVGQGFAFMDTLNIHMGDTVRWTWASSGHSVSSGDPCTINGQFCSPDNTNCQAGTLSNAGTRQTAIWYLNNNVYAGSAFGINSSGRLEPGRAVSEY